MKALSALRGSEQIRENFLAFMREAGSKIDPATAEIWWVPAHPIDPYGLGPDFFNEPFSDHCFVSSPGNKRAVWIGDLPIETREALRLKRVAEQSGNLVAPEIADPVDVGRVSSDASAGPPQGERAVTNPSNRPAWMTACDETGCALVGRGRQLLS